MSRQPHPLLFLSHLPEELFIKVIGVTVAGPLHTKSVWGGSLSVADMDKVPRGERWGMPLICTMGGRREVYFLWCQLPFLFHRFFRNYEKGKAAWSLPVDGTPWVLLIQEGRI